MAFMLLEGSHLNTHVLPEILAPHATRRRHP